MSGRFDPRTGRPFPYLVNLTDRNGDLVLSWAHARLCYAYAFNKILNMEGDELPMIRRTYLTDELLKEYGHFTWTYFTPADFGNIRKNGGLSIFQVGIYAFMCNRISERIAVYPPEFLQRLLYKKEEEYYRRRAVEGCPDLPTLAKWAEKGKIAVPETICFPYTNAETTHGMLFVAQRTTYPSSKNAYYETVYTCQIIDSALWHNLSEKSGRRPRFDYSLYNCRKLCKKLTEFFAAQARPIRFEPDIVANWYLHKLRQADHECGMYTCLHMRYFVGTLPLFIGKYEHPLMKRIIPYECYRHELIDFVALSRQFSITQMVEYNKNVDSFRWRTPHSTYMEGPLRQLYRLRLQSARNRPPNKKMPNLDFGKKVSFDIPSTLTKFTKTYCFGKPPQVPGQGRRGPRPDYGLIGDYDNIAQMPGEVNIKIPDGMNAPQILQFVYEDPASGNQTILAFRLDAHNN